MEIIIEYDKVIGDHATMYVNQSGTWEIYDPDGDYSVSKQTTNTDTITEEDGASKSEWEQASRNKADHIERFSTYVTTAEAGKIMNNIKASSSAHENLQNLPCARAISGVLSGVGPFKNVTQTSWPGALANQLRESILPEP